MELLDSLSSRFSGGLLGNSWERWLAALSISLGLFILTRVVRRLAISRLRKSAPPSAVRWDDAILLTLEKCSGLFLLVLALHFGTQGLELPERIARGRAYLFFSFFFFQLGVWLTHALRFYGESYFRETLAREPARATTVSTLMLFGDVSIWTLMAMLLFANFGVDITALVAGLGIGGVAVAFALQSILGDLFASFSIVLDKPFVIGDSIHVNGLTGTVEHIGLKTTRIRSNTDTGELLIFSNSELLKNVVRNYRRMNRRRVSFVFGLVYETPPERLNRAREIVRQVIEGIEGATFDRCHLATLAASSLDFEVAYWVESSSYNVYVDVHHRIVVGLLEQFSREALEFAYPHQVSVKKELPHAAPRA